MSPEGVGVFGGSVEEKYDVHVTRFSLGSAVKLPFVEGSAIHQGSYIVSCQAHIFFVGVFLLWGFLFGRRWG